MSGRRTGLCALGTVKLPQQPSPNHQVPQVTADLRIYWPRNARMEDIVKAVNNALLDMERQFKRRTLQ